MGTCITITNRNADVNTDVIIQTLAQIRVPDQRLGSTPSDTGLCLSGDARNKLTDLKETYPNFISVFSTSHTNENKTRRKFFFKPNHPEKRPETSQPIKMTVFRHLVLFSN